MLAIIRSISAKDYNEWFRMRDLLWPGEDRSLHKNEITECLQKSDQTAFVAERSEGGLCGLIEVGVRSCAEGCESNPVAYIEGWYVDEDMRSKGIGRLLLEEAENWARNSGHSEIASDCELTNETSLRVHLACGYKETIREIHFRKKL